MKLQIRNPFGRLPPYGRLPANVRPYIFNLSSSFLISMSMSDAEEKGDISFIAAII